MPFYPEEKSFLDQIQVLPEDNEESVEKKDRPAFFKKLLPAALNLENSFVSYMSADGVLTRPDRMDGIDKDFDPFENIEGYEDYAGRFAFTNNQDEVNRIKAKITQEREDKKTIEDGGWMGTLALVSAGALDPINYISFGRSAALKAGTPILKRGLETARGAALGLTASEIALHSSQETRTYGESAANIAAGAFIGGLLGTAAGAWKNRLARKGMGEEAAYKQVEKDLTIPDDIDLPRATGEGGSVGAAATKVASELQTTFGLGKLSGAPNISTASSPFETTRLASELIAENPLYFEKNRTGAATEGAAETEIRMVRNREMYNVVTSVEDEFLKYRDVTGPLALKKTQASDLMGTAKRDKKLTFAQFKEEVSKATRRGDIHDIPEVQAAAQRLRKTTLNKLKNEAIDVGIMSEGVKVTTAPSYLTRLWNREMVTTNRDQFKKIVMGWVKSQKDLDMLDASEVAEDIIHHILGTPGARILYQPVPLKRGPLKERVFNIPDELVEEFLINDIETVMNSYIKTMSADIALARRFDGDPTLKSYIDKIRAEYSQKVSKIKDGPNSKERTKLEKQLKKDIRNIEGMRDYLRDTRSVSFDNPYADKAAKVAKSLNYMRLLGYVGITAIPDLAGAITVNGLKRTLRDGYIPYIRNLRSIQKDLLSGTQDSTTLQAFQELKAMGFVVESILNQRSLTEIGSEYGATAFDKANKKATAAFTAMTGLPVMTDLSRTISSKIAGARVLRNATAKSLSKKEIQEMARWGLDREMLKRIGEQFKKHGFKENGDFIAGIEKWDPEVFNAYNMTLSKMTSTSVITPGLDRPLFLTTATGSLLGQFKSFCFAAYQRYFLAGIQQRDLATLNGAAVMVGLGMLVHFIKETLNGREVDMPLEQWLETGFEKSGMLGHFFEINDLVEKLSSNNLGLSAIMGDGPTSKYRQRSFVSSMAGPTAGLIEDVYTSTSAASRYLFNDKTPQSSEVKAFFRMWPYRRSFGISQLYDAAEKGLSQNLGVDGQ